jgi:hypothetical protein
MKRILLLTTLALMMFATASHAIYNDEYKYGVGLQWVDPVAYGPSFMWDLASFPMSLQAVLGLNNFPSPVIRARYAFLERQFLDGYAYGAVGVHEKNDDEEDGLAIFGGIGAGVEWDWREANSDLPPVSWSLELGLNDTNVSFGFGVHYTF